MDLPFSSSYESPAYLRTSLAAAITLGFKTGLFYRNAKLHCVNLLLTYRSGCRARCAYCGLSSRREGNYLEKSFIRVSWPTYAVVDIIRHIAERQKRVKRICISMVTQGRAVKDTKKICTRLRNSLDIPVSLLISPTMVTKQDLMDFKKAGSDKIGVAIDLATPRLFDRYRGSGVGGPHRWDAYMDRLDEAIDVFGERNAGSHFMVGMGETEKEMTAIIQQVQDMGGWTHLFSFFPENGSALENRAMPKMDHYRRIQLARHLIDTRRCRANDFSYDQAERISDFGLDQKSLDAVIDSGKPFRTSGCTGTDGEVACNRPFANSRPGPHIRNYPFPPTSKDIQRIRQQMGMPREYPNKGLKIRIRRQTG